MEVKIGRIKSGEGTLIGNAGEYFVTAELLKRGIIAALAPRNAPAFDILATNRSKTVRIRVKTKSSNYSDWQWVIKKDGTIFRFLQQTEDFTILVNLSPETRDMEYFVLPTPILDQWLSDDFDNWLATPGRNGRPHAADNKKRHLSYPVHAVSLAVYKDKWQTLWE
ncbi:MAG: hypothetical protein WD751_07925 [Anaerolineales bacterium]